MGARQPLSRLVRFRQIAAKPEDRRTTGRHNIKKSFLSERTGFREGATWQITIGPEWTRGGASCFHLCALGPAPLRQGVSPYGHPTKNVRSLASVVFLEEDFTFDHSWFFLHRTRPGLYRSETAARPRSGPFRFAVSSEALG